MAQEGRKRARLPLVEVLIGAVCAGGPRLSRVRSEFERMDAADGLKRLVLQAVDPELLAAVVGPRLFPVWVKPLRAQYTRFKQAYPADWVDVEKVWWEQRTRWRREEEEAASASGGSQAAAREYPARGGPRQGRAASPRAVRPSAGVAAAPPPAPRAAPAHRPVAPGAPAVHDPDVESIAAPPDEAVSGAVAEAAAEAADAADVARREAARREAGREPFRGGAGGAAGPASGGACNGAPVNPPAPPRPAAASRAPRVAVPSPGDGRIVLSGRVGELVERLLEAMTDSRVRVESVRRVWIDADGVAGGWDLWALDPAVLDRLPAMQRGVER